MGSPSPGSLRDVLATQMDPYYVAPLWPDAYAIEGLAARMLLESGKVSERQLAEIASRSRLNASANPHAVRTQQKSVEEILAGAVFVGSSASFRHRGVRRRWRGDGTGYR